MCKSTKVRISRFSVCFFTQLSQLFSDMLSKLPAKKKLLSQLKHQQQQNAIQNQAQQPPTQSSLSINPIIQAHATTNLMNSKEPEPMDQDDDDEEINVHDDDSPLDMRITKHDSDSDSVRPSVIRRAPSFKETSNSPSRGKFPSSCRSTS